MANLNNGNNYFVKSPNGKVTIRFACDCPELINALALIPIPKYFPKTAEACNGTPTLIPL